MTTTVSGETMDLAPQGIRFVLYPAVPGSLPEAAEAWKLALPDREPTTIQRSQAMAPGVTQSLAAGVVRGLNVTITVQPGRLDLLAGRGDPWFVNGSKPLELEELLRPAIVYGGKITEAFACTRIALVLDLISDAGGWDEAGAKFRQSVPSLNLPSHTQELTLAVNATRAFQAAADLKMNRLCKWETAHFQYMLLQAGPMSAGIQAGQPPFSARHALSVQFDLSSEIRVAALERAQAGSILRELGDETRLLVAEGYQRLIA